VQGDSFPIVGLRCRNLTELRTFHCAEKYLSNIGAQSVTSRNKLSGRTLFTRVRRTSEGWCFVRSHRILQEARKRLGLWAL